MKRRNFLGSLFAAGTVIAKFEVLLAERATKHIAPQLAGLDYLGSTDLTSCDQTMGWIMEVPTSHYKGSPVSMSLYKNGQFVRKLV